MNDKKVIEDEINQALDSSIENLTPEVRRNLNRMRIDAIENKKKTLVSWKYASALSIIFAVVIGFKLVPTTIENDTRLFAEVLEEDIEMLDELEFVYWMAESKLAESDLIESL